MAAGNLTNAFSKIYNVTRLMTTRDRKEPLKLLDRSGTQIGSLITSGWLPEQIIGEEAGERLVEVRITDRAGYDFAKVVFFIWGGFRYERLRFPNPPTGNPQEWIWQVKPIGVEAASGDRIIDDAGNSLVDDAGNSIIWGTS